MKSAVAGIIDSNGGLRVVVTQRWRMHHHVKKGEKLFVVPGLKVREPVSLSQAADLIETVKKHIAA
jgi:hypothetical protein